MIRYFAAFLAGLAYSFGFAPFDYWVVTFTSIAALFWLMQTQEVSLARLAWCFGVGKYAIGTSWIYVSIHVYGGAPPILAGALVALFTLGMALFMWPVGWLFERLRAPNNVVLNIIVFTGAWVLLDWMLTWFLTGFPWLLPGYAFMATPMIGLAPIAGVLGMNVLVVISACSVAVLIDAIRNKEGGHSWVAGAGTLAPWIVGILLTAVTWTQPVLNEDGDAVRKSVVLVQGNIAQSTKWDEAKAAEILGSYMRLSENHWDTDLLVWPEAAVTYYPQQIDQFLQELDQRAAARSTNFITGIPTAEKFPSGEFKVYNSALGMGLADGRFSKIHLVPFGEYVPLESMLRGLIGFFDLPMSGMSAGAPTQKNIMTNFGPVAMAVCYEIAYPDSVRRRAADAELLITITNDTWFGGSIGPHQHLQLARMRAIESGRWLVRSTNDGVTAIVDHNGDVTARLPQFEVGVLRGEFQLMQGRTPYNRYGDWGVLAFVALTLVGATLLRIKNRNPST